jgi:hypothetical protein
MIAVEPIHSGDYYDVSLTVSAIAEDGKYHWLRPYERLRIVQQLPETMGVEVWTLAVVCEITDAIKLELTRLVNQGTKTLMVDGNLDEEHLRVGSRPRSH